MTHNKRLKLTIWNEYRHELVHSAVKEIYPDGMHQLLAKKLAPYGYDIRTATLDEPEHGLSVDVLEETDVLIWWGHMAHHEVSDEVVQRVQQRVLGGMGLVVLHSGHFSKIFKALMGTTCDLKWREADEKERLWVVNPAHPIASGIGEYIEIEQEEMYGEHFDIPTPDELIFVSWFEGGEVFRSGCTFYRGQGRIFYFRPGHETYPTYYNDEIIRVIANGVDWAGVTGGASPKYGNAQPLETISKK